MRIETRRQTSISRRSTIFGLSAALTLGTLPAVAAAAPARPSHVDLTQFQTPLKRQGGRRTCIVFAAVAALEAAYRRAGYGELDLSEQFLNHFGKMFWLDEKWERVAAKGEDGGEAQVGPYGGGHAIEYIEELTKGIRIPLESALPYRGKDYAAADHPHFANDWRSPFWTQRNMDDINLSERFLPRAALTQPLYYGVKRYATLDARDPDAIERALASGHEVAWDFHTVNTGQDVWTPCRPEQGKCPSGTHAMLLVGYDRRGPDPAKHYFIAKNSYGPTRHPGGMTYISYDYVRRQGIMGGYILEVAPPAPWPELAFIGRWTLDVAGQTGTLDVYHIPGVAQWHLDKAGGRIADRRIGAFYDANGKAFRVNGRIAGDRMELYIDARNPNARWDQLGGRRIVIPARLAARALVGGA